MNKIPHGAYPAMLTPFLENGEIDYPGVRELLRWYERMGCTGVLALCASSETDKLTYDERVKLANFICENKGKLTIVVSGHVSEGFDDQVKEMNAMAQSGADGLCFIVARVNYDAEKGVAVGNAEFIERLKRLEAAVKTDLPLGFYEWPNSYNRSLDPEIVKYCVSTGRYGFMKETSCRPPIIKAKIEAAAGSTFGVYNANSTFLYESLKDGAAGFCGIMGNYHPDLYQWLCDNWDKNPEAALKVSDFIGAVSQIPGKYPKTAKYHQNCYGAKMSTFCRRGDNEEPSPENLERIHQTERLCNDLRAWLKTL